MRVIPIQSAGYLDIFKFRRKGNWTNGCPTPRATPVDPVYWGYYYGYYYSQPILEFCPMWFPETVRVDRLAFYNCTGVGGGLARCGIYLGKRSGSIIQVHYPDRLIVDGGEKDCSTTGLKETSFDPPLILSGPQIYWTAFLGNSLNLQPWMRNVCSGYLNADTNELFGLWKNPYSYGVLPDPAPSSMSQGSSLGIQIQVRLL
jgi:hypothetical protein